MQEFSPVATTINGGPIHAAIKTSRLGDFFTEDYLTKQVGGHDKEVWPLYVLKELIDNSIDACEEVGTSPTVAVTVDADSITVTDNGPGIPPNVVTDALDFSSRVSSRWYEIRPTRGRQGNALQTLLAMPYVLDDQRCGNVTITARGVRHSISVSYNQIESRPDPRHDQQEAPDCKSGTIFRVEWPNSASRILDGAKSRFLQIVHEFAILNPHLSISCRWKDGKPIEYAATNPDWAAKKFRSCDPTSAIWYTPEQFRVLLCAYISDDRRRGADRTVREVIATFDRFTSTARQKQVMETAGISKGTKLSELIREDGTNVDAGRVVRLLEEMNRAVADHPIKPENIGVIGKKHLRARFEEAGVGPQSFKYLSKLGPGDDGLPRVVEVAFGIYASVADPTLPSKARHLVQAANWSPSIAMLYRNLGGGFGGIDALLANRNCGAYEPIMIVAHTATPHVSYTDQGKSGMVMKEAA